ncbi:MAG: 23S rRNA (uracil(1939)-C(5))-methyltransferase RlmD [Oceanospirillaceae bacterium]
MSRNKIQFGRPSKSKVKLTDISLSIENLSLDGRGVARYNGKTVFVDGAIPGETVSVKITQQHKMFDEATILSIEEPSELRIEANCEHFNHCGGCQLQHIEADAQLHFKQKAVLSLLEHNSKIIPLNIASPLASKSVNYRRTARIGVNQLGQNQGAIVGFRRKNSSKLLQVSKCNVLTENFAALFDQLRETLEQIENAKAITHVELLQGDQQGALTFRCKAILSPTSCALLVSMLQSLNLQGFLRYDDSLVKLKTSLTQDTDETLDYKVNDLVVSFKPGDFIQVNALVNQQMINRAISWLALEKSDEVLDLFAGLGNFSLPIAQQVSKLVGIEGSKTMVERATENASSNQLANCQFYSADLSSQIDDQPWFEQSFNKIILDPPRSGAYDVISNLFAKDSAHTNISHIVYVACDPTSFARDAKLLANLGYQIQEFCVMDMFPNTTHIESMALFTKNKNPIIASPSKKSVKRKIHRLTNF